MDSVSRPRRVREGGQARGVRDVSGRVGADAEGCQTERGPAAQTGVSVSSAGTGRQQTTRMWRDILDEAAGCRAPTSPARPAANTWPH